MFSHILTRSYRDSSSVTVQQPETITADSELPQFDGVAVHATDTETALTATRAKLKSLMISADKAIIVNTNAINGAGGDIIPVAANQVIVWSLASDGLSKCPFTVDVTAIWLHNASGSVDANVKIRGLYDAT